MQTRLLQVPQVAEILGTTQGRVYELVRLSLIPAVRLGRQVRIDEAALHEWIRNGGQALPGGWKK